jgi:hypothetical protein
MAFLPDDTFFGTSPSDEQRAFWPSDLTSGAPQPMSEADSFGLDGRRRIA